jgi:hypothetical protein
MDYRKNKLYLFCFFEKPSHEPNTSRKGTPKGILVRGAYRGMGAY